MARVHVNVSVHFSEPVENVFSYFAEHENQEKIFGVKVERLAHGKHERNGVGSRRRLHALYLPAFEETITAFERNTRIEYKMSDSWKNPIHSHLGVLIFAPRGSGTFLDYSISFQTRIPFTKGIIQSMTEANLRKGLEAMASRWNKS